VNGGPAALRRPEARLWLAGAGLVMALAAAGALVHPLLGLAGVLAILAAPIVLAHRGLALGLVILVIALLPFGALPLNLGFNPTLLDLALAGAYLIWVMRLVTRAETTTALATPAGMALVIFLGLAVVAFLAGLAQGTPSKNQLRTFAELVLAAGLFVVVLDLVRDRTTLRRLFLALAALGTAAAALGLALYLLPASWQVSLLSPLRVLDYPSGPAVLRFLNDDPARLQRATGSHIDPNAFGGFLALVAALLLPQAFTRSGWLPRWLALGALALVSATTLATVSRAALLGLIAAALLVAAVRDRRLLALGLAAGGLLLAAAWLLPWSQAYLEHFAQGLVGADRATQMRFGEYRDALRLIERYPLLGIGFGDVRDADLYRGVSSLYLIVAVSMGLAGLAAFLALLAAVAAWLAAGWRRLAASADTADLAALALGSLAALVAVAVSGLFDHYFFTYPHELALLWFVLGLGGAAVRLGRSEATGSGPARG
jgi:hypothetical protein